MDEKITGLISKGITFIGNPGKFVNKKFMEVQAVGAVNFVDNPEDYKTAEDIVNAIEKNVDLVAVALNDHYLTDVDIATIRQNTKKTFICVGNTGIIRYYNVSSDRLTYSFEEMAEIAKKTTRRETVPS